MLTPAAILGHDGFIAEHLDRYECRQEQLTMADAVNEAFAAKKHLAVEAGTGVGKSFAYLVPSILQTTGEHSQPIKAVISTHTISLQEQIIEKDVPFLQSVLPFKFSAVLVKGRSNYLCLRRLHSVCHKPDFIIDDAKNNELNRLLDWSKTTADGSVSDLNPEPDFTIWNEICCESGNCLGRQCLHNTSCFYRAARNRIAAAQILVVNHALLFSDIAMRASGGSILPQYEMLVLDEAHTIESVAADHFGISISQGQVEYNLNRLYNSRTQKGLLMRRAAIPRALVTSGSQAVEECFYAAEVFFHYLADWLQDRPGSNGRVRQSGIVNNPLSGAIRKLKLQIQEIIEALKEPEDQQELRSAKDRMESLSVEIDTWMAHGLEDESVYWLESMPSFKGCSKTKICASPINVGAVLREHLFGKIPSVVLTSATLTAAGRQPFVFFKTQVGMPELDTVQLGSPFDFEKQTTLVVLKDAPLPDEQDEVLRPFYDAMLRRYISESNGGAFVLFTSYQLLRKTANDLTSWLAERDFPLFVQGAGMTRSEMVRRFKESSNAVLFGTDSFWQGVDVPGNTLRNVIITKLPFLVPSQPVIEAKIESIKARGGVPFREYQLPQAVLKFKQGFGRLVRTKTDSGLVVVLDPRIQTKSYGRNFIESLPKCKRRFDSAVV